MMSSKGVRVLFLAASLGVLGCSVDDSLLGSRFWPCTEDSDCGDGYGCLRAGGYAHGRDYCLPACDPDVPSACDGTCMRVFDNPHHRGLCAAGCGISEDGTTSHCAGEPDLECIRTNASDQGLCYPVERCSTADDCGEGELCLSQPAVAVATLLGLDLPSDNFYCVPRARQMSDLTVECDPGQSPLPLPIGVAPDGRQPLFAFVCLPQCSTTDPACPPGFGCLTTSALVSGSQVSACFPGLYGIPCTDDSNCLFGRCLGVAEGAPDVRFCTETCEDAIPMGGCERLMHSAVSQGRETLCCEGVCGAGAPTSGICRPVFGIGGPCGPAYPCLPGLTCMTVPEVVPGDGPPRTETFCTKQCAVSIPVGTVFPDRVTEDCGGALGPYDDYWCATAPPELGPSNDGVCRLRGDLFSRCYVAAQDMCVENNFCVGVGDGTGYCIPDLADGLECICLGAACPGSGMCQSGCCAFDAADARNECVTRAPCI